MRVFKRMSFYWMHSGFAWLRDLSAVPSTVSHILLFQPESLFLPAFNDNLITPAQIHARNDLTCDCVIQSRITDI